MRHVIRLDWDFIPPAYWVDKWEKMARAGLAALGYRLVEVRRRPSSSGKGMHVWVEIEGPRLKELDKVMLAWLLCDDTTRVRINIKRVERGVRFWDKLFTYKQVVKQRRRTRCRCKACQKLMKILREV